MPKLAQVICLVVCLVFQSFVPKPGPERSTLPFHLYPCVPYHKIPLLHRAFLKIKKNHHTHTHKLTKLFLFCIVSFMQYTKTICSTYLSTRVPFLIRPFSQILSEKCQKFRICSDYAHSLCLYFHVWNLREKGWDFQCTKEMLHIFL